MKKDFTHQLMDLTNKMEDGLMFGGGEFSPNAKLYAKRLINYLMLDFKEFVLATPAHAWNEKTNDIMLALVKRKEGDSKDFKFFFQRLVNGKEVEVDFEHMMLGDIWLFFKSVCEQYKKK